MTMKNPPHPGGVVLRQCIEPSGLTITDAAAAGNDQATGAPQDTLTVTDNRTGRSYELPIQDGTVVFRDERIIAAGANIAVPPDAKVIDAHGPGHDQDFVLTSSSATPGGRQLALPATGFLAAPLSIPAGLRLRLRSRAALPCGRCRSLRAPPSRLRADQRA